MAGKLLQFWRKSEASKKIDALLQDLHQIQLDRLRREKYLKSRTKKGKRHD